MMTDKEIIKRLIARDSLCSFECETFIPHHYDYDIDRWSLLKTAKPNSWLREDDAPLHHVSRLNELKGFHVERKYNAGMTDIETVLDNGYDVIVIVDKDAFEGRAASNPDLVPYFKLSESKKEYDRIMAMNTLRLVRRLAYNITPNQNYNNFRGNQYVGYT